MSETPREDDLDLAAAFGRDSTPQSRRSRISLPEPPSDPAHPEPIALPRKDNNGDEHAGRYRLQGEIARGGMGQILKGHDPELGRMVAIKVLHEQYRDAEEVLDRFVEEAQIGGQLQHPGIVPVYELGTHDGKPFFAMKLVKGKTLAALLSERSGPGDDRRRLLDVFEAICQTMAYAHSRSVLHRDLKPANVLVGAFGEVQVVDWGLAKVMAGDEATEEEQRSREETHASVIETIRSKPGSDGSQSRAGSVLGTPAYMPPEQARGEMERLDERADVFALGAILCEILTGAPPYVSDGDGHGDHTLVLAARGELEPAHERLEACGADRELVALCEECLAPARQARPQDAAVLAERVSAYLHAVEERAQQAEVRAAKARFKQRTTLLVSTVALLLVSFGAGGWIWTEQQARQRRVEATQRANTAIGEAQSRRGEALAAPTDVALWDRAVSSAEAAVQMSEDDVEPAARENATALLREVRAGQVEAVRLATQAARDAAMRERLVDLRIPADEGVAGGPNWWLVEVPRLTAAYEQAFDDYLEAPVRAIPVAEVVAAVENSAIRSDLTAALNHWCVLNWVTATMLRESSSTVAEQTEAQQLEAEELAELTEKYRRPATVLATIAAALDDGQPWRQQIRNLLPNLRENREEIRSIADRVAIGELSGADIRLLSDVLQFTNAVQASIDLLRRGFEQHPQDLDLCLRLALGEEYGFDPSRMRSDASRAHLQAAYDAYRIAHALAPDKWQIVYRIARVVGLKAVYHRRQGPAEAGRWAAKLGAMAPHEPRALGTWVHHLIGSGDYEAARDVLERAGDLVERDCSLLNQRGEVRMRLGQESDAQRDFEKAIELSPGELMKFLPLSNLGLLLAHRNEFDAALPLLERAEKLHPDMHVLNSLSVLHARKGDLASARRYAQRIVEIDPLHAKAWWNLAQICKDLGLEDETLAAMQRANEVQPDDAELRVVWAQYLVDFGRLNEAGQKYREALAMADTAATRNGYGYVLAEQGDDTRAIEMFEAALRLDPNLAKAHTELARALERRNGRGELARALHHYRRGAALAPDNWYALQNLAAGEMAVRNYETAEALLLRVLPLRPKDPWVHLHLGQAYRFMGRFEAARQQLERSRELGMTDVTLHVSLAIVAAALGDFAVAVENGRAVRPGLGDLDLLQEIGGQLWGQGHARQARAVWVHALSIDPEHEVLRDAVDMADAVEEVLAGTRLAQSSAELQEAIDVGYSGRRFEQLRVLVARTLEQQPDLIDSQKQWGLYNAACAAATAARNADPAKATERRELALAWLEREVQQWLRDPDSFHDRLQRSVDDPDFEGVRDEALQAVPADERARWQELWRSIRAALKGEKR